ncbi:S-adenosylmethionine:tRNA ribosyltransferase-isomerase [Thalassobacillus pellis]|uniref:S-adenosylmethionine:tRNA ribosyltransferase-isomerase n=1 Tax=Thalassobacillus pellis TaxID=748008 RepID=UPI001EF8947B|nr:S-adenosylmethionine:tRNA ribosyltransferase-isomerase [Thalassobacillus pellis]MBM7554220.1 S-adenosylmethionine:tRNA ribosyltransferase-isomerase [Thalassobacillus pellis]
MMQAVSYPFDIPEKLNASIPAELKKGSRDQVKMMVLDRTIGHTKHDDFFHIDNYLQEGDLVVLNNSRTIPPVLFGKQGNTTIEVRLSRTSDPSEWEALLIGDFIQVNQPISFGHGLQANIIGPGAERPLVNLKFSEQGPELIDYIFKYGEPIRYEYIDTPWPLEYYQTVYGSVPGSVEMPSAGRAFSWRVINKLKQRGVKIGYLQLHTGLSYYGKDRWPDPKAHPEEFTVPEKTAQLINETREKGGRVIAVGTTVVRALESSFASDGLIKAKSGFTNLYVDQHHHLQAVDGLLTGFHEPEASHLDMLTAFIKEELLMKAYKEAIESCYLWHEFGDVNLILPRKPIL